MNLPRYTLAYDKQKDNWKLEKDGSRQVIKRFGTKEEATAGGVLKSAIGKEGGSVRIEKMRGGYQEERTFPRKKDPQRSPG